MKNVTITLDERTTASARRLAAERGLSLSRLIGELLTAHMAEGRAYQAAMRQFLDTAPVRLKSAQQRYAPRAAVHDRSGLR